MSPPQPWREIDAHGWVTVCGQVNRVGTDYRISDYDDDESMKLVFAHSYSLECANEDMLWQTVQFLVHPGTRMIVDSCYSSGAGSEFHADGPATAKLRGP